ncbi:MAG TPA: nucleotidyltransferase domain-containing protein [Candidatus Wallbacteria bacterium]|nr:nucleotidyltransferase domain-containing protein [Candidatus Wallbacteria bacterium]
MISENLIEEVKNRLIETYKPLEIYLFGSYAWGGPDEHSDLDLLVVVDRSDKKSYKRPIPGMRSLIGLKIPKDILVYTREEFDRMAGDVSTLCYKIKTDGKKIYGILSDVA